MTLDEVRLQALRLLSDQPGRIRTAALKMLKLQGDHDAIEAAAKRRRLAVTLEVANLTGADGKKTYSNEQARNAAIETALERDEAYQSAQKRLQAIAEELAFARIDLGYEQDVLGSARAAARILGGEAA